MGILDKLRPQAKWKHGDPSVRLEAVQALGDGDTDVLLQVATEDHDARVRRAAVARIADADTLAAVTRNDSDPGTRDSAVQRLVTLAGEPDTAAKAVAALGALGRHRELATLARSSAPEASRQAAVALLTEAKALGGIARHAADPGTRLLALERLSDEAELEAVAVNGEHADAAVAALDRLTSPSAERLGVVAQRAKTRAVAKRAKSLLAALTAPVADTPPPAVEYKEADQAAAHALVEQMQSLGGQTDLAAVRDGYAAARVAWVELLADAEVEPRLVEEFETLSDRVRSMLAADEAARADATRHAETLRLEQAERLRLCEQVEALPAEAMPDGLTAAREAWAALPPMPDEWAADLQRRFDDASKAAERRQEQAQHTRELREQAPQVVADVEALVSGDYATVRSQWQALRRKWQAILRTGDVDPGLAERFAAASTTFEAREDEVRAGKLRQQQDNLHRLQAVVQALETRAAAEALSLKDADAIIKDVKLAVGTMGPLPTPQDREDVTVRLQAVRAAVQPRLEELRERRGMEALGQRPGAGRAVHQDGGAHHRGRGRPGQGRRTRCGRCRSGGSR